MITLIKYPKKNTWKSLLARPTSDYPKVEHAVRAIIEQVKSEGDNALRDFSLKFDGVTLDDFRVSDAEIEDAAGQVSAELKTAIETAAENIRKFHSAQLSPIEKIETSPGVLCWRKSVAIESVGLYIPGGTAPLFSTVLMLGIPAKLAGCAQIILCTPSGSNGEVHPAVLYAARVCGISEIYKVGGAQAIAAMAFGTTSIPKVNKLFGPGNQYVTLAKQLVQENGLAIDMPAGPSELAVLADETANPSFVAADLLSQAEHGHDSQVILVSASEKFLFRVEEEVRRQLENLPRKSIAESALRNSKFILVETEMDGIAMLNAYAPEHLILNCSNAEQLAEMVINAGSVFLGNYTPESAGDYASGTNHTLPTNGYAQAYSGVSVDSFVRKITFQQISSDGLKILGPVIELMAESEGLIAHKNAVTIRNYGKV